MLYEIIFKLANELSNAILNESYDRNDKERLGYKKGIQKALDIVNEEKEKMEKEESNKQ